MSEDWLARWKEGRTGWHEAGGNDGLKTHWQVTGRRVLVPLCGKSRDLLWLARQGNRVVGIDLAETAIHAFFADNDLGAEQVADSTWRARDVDITLHCGDFFAFEDEPFDAHYDRAALIALPPDLRPAYARKVDSLLTGDAYRVVVTVDYDQSLIDGPPFAVPAPEVLRYWPGLTQVATKDDLETSPPRFRDAGLTDVREIIWRTPAG